MQRQLYYDVKNGVLNAWKKYFGILILMIVLCVLQYTEAITALKQNIYLDMPSFGNYLFKWFRGMVPITSTISVTKISIPQEWMLLHFLFLLLIVRYTRNDFKANGYRLFLSIGNKKNWWISKIIWVWISAACYYGMLLLCIFFTALCSKDIALVPHSGIWIGDFAFTIDPMYLITIFILPIFTLAALGSIQIWIEFIFSPIYAMIFSLGYLLMGIYWVNPLLISNNIMLYRNACFMQHNGIHTSVELFVCVCMILSSLAGGLLYLKHYDF